MVMTDPHNNDISPIRTFADDIKRVKKNAGSSDADTAAEPIEETMVAKEATLKQEEVAAPAVANIPKAEPISDLSMSGRGIDKSAFDYLAQSNKKSRPTQTNTDQASTPTKVMNRRSAPVIQDTDVSLAVERITSNNKMTVLHDEGLVNVDDDLYAGTIIQDKKRDNWKLVPAMGQAMTDWYKDKEQDYIESRQPTHTITKSEARIDTIKAAAEASKRAPSADYQTVSERLRAQEYEVDTAGIQVKDASEVPPPSWTYTVEEETDSKPTPLSDEPPITTGLKPDNESVVNITDTEMPKTEMTKTTEPATITNKMNVSALDISNPSAGLPTPMPQATPTADNFSRNSMDQENIIEPNVTPVNTDHEATSIENSPASQYVEREESVSAAQYLATEPVSDYEQESQNRLQAAAASVNRGPGNAAAIPRAKLPNPTHIPLYVFAVGFLAICLLGVGVSLYLFTTANNQPAVVMEATLQPLVKAKTVKLSIDPARESVINRLALSSEKEGLNIYELYTTGNNTLTPAQTVANIVPYELSALARNTDNFAIGFTEQERPYMIMEGSNFEELFGGLLRWETTMNRDLSPLFGPDLGLTPRVITGNLIDDSQFTDEVIMNRTARVLYDNNEQEVLVYVFIDKTTVIVASDRGDIINMIPKLN